VLGMRVNYSLLQKLLTANNQTKVAVENNFRVIIKTPPQEKEYYIYLNINNNRTFTLGYEMPRAK
jgi:hypothetical protein